MNASRFIARVLGLCGLSIGLVCLITQGRLIEQMIDALEDPTYLLGLGLMTLLIGVAMVVGHNIWDGSWRVVITVIGYLSLLKGFVILAWPEGMMTMANRLLGSGLIWGQMIFAVVFYSWLAWLGFRRESSGTAG